MTAYSVAAEAGANPVGDAVAYHRAESRRSLSLVDASLAGGDLEKASQALWEAAAHGVRAAAARRGWPSATHRDLGRVISRLIDDEGGPIDLNTNFFIAHSFDRVDREWEMPLLESEVRYCREPVTALLKMLETMD